MPQASKNTPVTVREFLAIFAACGLGIALFHPGPGQVTEQPTVASPVAFAHAPPRFDHVPSKWDWVEATCRDYHFQMLDMCRQVAETDWDANFARRRP